MPNNLELLIYEIGQATTEVISAVGTGKPLPRRSLLLGTLPSLIIACSGQRDFRDKEEDEATKIELYLPQGLRQPDTGEFTYTFKERSLTAKPQRLEDFVERPLRIKMVIDARSILLMGFKGGIGRTDESMTRIAWETTIKNVNPNSSNVFRLTWDRWKFQGATWNNNDLPLKIQQTTV